MPNKVKKYELLCSFLALPPLNKSLVAIKKRLFKKILYTHRFQSQLFYSNGKHAHMYREANTKFDFSW